MEVLSIFSNVLLPILILIGIGAFVHLKFQLDIKTLAKINIYYLVPGLIFIRLYETELDWELFFNVLIFFIGLSILLHGVSKILARIMRFHKGMRLAFSHSVLFYNAGNYGVPVNDLVFRQDPVAMAVQVLVVTFQNLLVYTYGIISLHKVEKGRFLHFSPLLKMPVLYAMLFGILLNTLDIDLPTFIYIPGSYVADALIAIALLTLGAQVVQLSFGANMFPVFISVAVRLAISPLLAYFIISFLDVDSVSAQTMFIASALPSSVNSAIIAQEYNNEPDFAAQVVLTSTVLSIISVTVVIFLSKVIYT